MIYIAHVFAIECRNTCQNTFSVDPQDTTETLDWEAGALPYAGELMNRDRHKAEDDTHDSRKRTPPSFLSPSLLAQLWGP